MAVYIRGVPGPPERPPILIVCYGFPPYRGIGGRRWAKFAKALAQRGRTVHVIACAPATDEAGSLWSRDVQRPNIVVHHLPRHYPRSLYRRPLTTLGDKLAYRFWNTVLPWFTTGNHFDKSVFWRKPLLATATRLIDAHAIRHVIVSGAPFRNIHHLAVLKMLRPIRAIAEVRDPWTWEAGYGWKLLNDRQRAQEKAIEAAALSAADLVLAPSENFISHLQAAYPDLRERMVHLPHAVDPEDLPPRRATAGHATGLRLIMAGSFYDRPHSRAFLAVLARSVVAIERGATARKVRVDIHATVAPPAEFVEAVRAEGAEQLVRFLPAVPSAELYARLQQADLALGFHPPERRDLVATKFSEYLLLGVPVLFVSEPGKASQFIEARQGGLCVPLERLPQTLEQLAAGNVHVPRPDPERAREFLLDALCDRLEREVLN